jgi:CMP-N,N'-diacetyllegionaminic acid synthase
MKTLAIIPARGGSKGIPRKNIAMLDENPLIFYTIKAALESESLTDIVVSTDDKEIADISAELGALVPFIRPLHLSTDEAESAPVIDHTLKFMEEKRGFKYDAIMMLQPTSPLRKSTHINEALALFGSQSCDSLVSIVSVGANHPLRMKLLEGNKLTNYVDQGFWNMMPRQSLPKVFIRNGSIYLISRDSFIQTKQLIGENCLGYQMGDNESINIDSHLDLMLAEILLKRGKSD